MKNLCDLYGEDYFERGIESNVSCYNNYRWIPELTIPMAARLIEHLNIREDEKILDFGCAKGYLVYALRLLHRQAYGYDISSYALAQAPVEVKNFVSDKLKLGGGTYDWIVSKDVFEHIPYEDIDAVIRNLATLGKKLFCVVPLGENGKYFIPAYELDKTHIIRENLDWWKQKFADCGFEAIEAAYKVKYIKENWSWGEKGNGFFEMKSSLLGD